MRPVLALAALAACTSSAPPPRAPARFAELAAAIERGEAPDTRGVLVMRGGEILHEACFAGADGETLHDTRSVGKSMTALAVGIAIERGALPGTDAPVFPYLADLAPFGNPGPLKDAITVEDFLTMSSALDCDDDVPTSPGNEENMYPLREWARWAVDLPVRADYRRDASGRGPWHYCTAGTFLLGQVIQRTARQPIDEFMARHLFAPLGITRWEFSRSPTGEVMTGGGLRLRAREGRAMHEQTTALIERAILPVLACPAADRRPKNRRPVQTRVPVAGPCAAYVQAPAGVRRCTLITGDAGAHIGRGGGGGGIQLGLHAAHRTGERGIGGRRARGIA
jgi:CubicO group peptidase (beta-lactamase class C family)